MNRYYILRLPVGDIFMKKTNYLTNKELLIQIQKSKNTYCQFEAPEYANYDFIIEDINCLFDEDLCNHYYGDHTTGERKEIAQLIQDIKEQKAKKVRKLDDNSTISANDILTSDLVFRVMTYEHIPLDPEWDQEKPLKKRSDGYMKVNFPPFMHYIIQDGIPVVVGRSHYNEGKFDPDCGYTTNQLGRLYMLLVERISKKGNWRNYSYLEDMKGDALRQLSQVGLQFDESRGKIPNPFAFYTTVVNNAFKRILNSEKKIRDIRDDLIEINGEMPSFTRQLESDISSGYLDYSTPKTNTYD